MPKISEEQKAARRSQILDAAWTCFQKEGLHATTMDDIIRASGLSAGAVYSYFKNKEDLIVQAITTSLGRLSVLTGPVLQAVPALPPSKMLVSLCEAISAFAVHQGFDLRRIALIGWSEAQRNERLRQTMLPFYGAFRERLTVVVRQWQENGLIKRETAPEEVAALLLSALMGYVVQTAVLGEISPNAMGRALEGLVPQHPA